MVVFIGLFLNTVHKSYWFLGFAPFTAFHMGTFHNLLMRRFVSEYLTLFECRATTCPQSWSLKSHNSHNVKKKKKNICIAMLQVAVIATTFWSIWNINCKWFQTRSNCSLYVSCFFKVQNIYFNNITYYWVLRMDELLHRDTQ